MVILITTRNSHEELKPVIFSGMDFPDLYGKKNSNFQGAFISGARIAKHAIILDEPCCRSKCLANASGVLRPFGPLRALAIRRHELKITLANQSEVTS